MRTDIRVPKFMLDAGGAGLIMEKPYETDDAWVVTMPNHLNLRTERRLRLATFDEARERAEALADVLTKAEYEFQALRERTAKWVEEILTDT